MFEKEQLDVVLTSDLPKNIYIDSSFMSMTEFSKFCQSEKGAEVLEKQQLFYILPPVFRKETAAAFTEEYLSLQEIPWHGFVVKNLESYQWLLKMDNNMQLILIVHLFIMK